MSTGSPYPKYQTYDDIHRHPSLLDQEFPRPRFESGDIYYPTNDLIEPLFLNREESLKFGAACFCGFLEDTVEVEHCLVIPSIATIRRLPFEIPVTAEQDLFKLATDEGFHAEQSQQFLTDMRSHFGLTHADGHRTPLFLLRLEAQRAAEPNQFYRDLLTVLYGVITETRISIELSRFANDETLADSVRDVCRTHAEDESIHASQFRALGQWLWSEFDEATKIAAARFLNASTIARSLPDVERMAYFLHLATDRPLQEARKNLYDLYTTEKLIERLLVETKPTVAFLQRLGVEIYEPFSVALDIERGLLDAELMYRRQEVNGAVLHR